MEKETEAKKFSSVMEFLPSIDGLFTVPGKTSVGTFKAVGGSFLSGRGSLGYPRLKCQFYI